MDDIVWMKKALRLAKKGEGAVNPNPLVGAIVVKDGQVVAKGYHKQYGKAHAEREALLHAKKDVRGATLYVTLEPCCHYGKTPPCTNIIIEKKIKRVVIGTLDPNPLVAGKGVKQLKEAGIEVMVGVLEKECKQINEVFFHFLKTNLPLVTLKYAMTLDGKIATKTGDSKWITGEKARRDVHKLRNKNRAIMVGINTVKLDNPMLNVRGMRGRDPIRIICDCSVQIPMESNIVQTAKEIKTMIIIADTVEKDPIRAVEKEKKIKELIKKGCQIKKIKMKHKGIDLKELLHYLGEQKIDSLLIEGGKTLATSAIEEDIVDILRVYIAPKLCMGDFACTPLGKEGITFMQQAYKVNEMSIRKIGEDVCMEGRIKKSCLQD